MAEEIDYSEDANLPQNDARLNIAKLVDMFINKKRSVAAAEAELKEAKADLHRYEFETLPQAMIQGGSQSFVSADGHKVTLSDHLDASLPSLGQIKDAEDGEREELIKRRQQGFEWLRENNGASLIKNQIIIDVPKGADSAADEIMALAAKLQLTWERGESVHAASLKSFIKEKLKMPNVVVPLELFRVFQGKRAKLTPPKNKDLI